MNNDLLNYWGLSRQEINRIEYQKMEDSNGMESSNSDKPEDE